MTNKEYKGKILHLAYPSFLKVKTEEPQWSAYGPKGRAAAVIIVNPQPAAVEAFSRLVRNPFFTRAPGAFIEHEGHFKTPKGIEGYERVTRVSETMAWLIDGKFQERHILNIQLWAVKSDWYDGTIWQDCVNSIEVVGNSTNQDLVREPVAVKLTRKPILKKQKLQPVGILCELPVDLYYLLDIASEIDLLTEGKLEDHPEVFQVLEAGLKKETRLLTKQKAQVRIKLDRERLWSWLQQHPADKYPETTPLYVVAGILINAYKG